MNKFLLLLTFVLSATFMFAQNDLDVYNYTNQVMYVWGAESVACNGVGMTTPTVTIQPNGGMATLTTSGIPGAEWYGFKAAASIMPFSAPYGKFHNPCNNCGGIDIAVGLNVSWSNNCEAARIY